ncbi:MAG: hypothetical protein V4560_18320 [Bacteroidota bacterium]
MANNNNISIDVEINASGQQQLNQYKAAFDGLNSTLLLYVYLTYKIV